MITQNTTITEKKKPRAYISFELKKMKKHKFVTVIGQQVIKQFPDNIQTNSRFI